MDRKAKGLKLYTLLRLGFALVATFIVCQIDLPYFESFLYDLRVQLRPARSTTGLFHLVIIENSTISALKKTPRISDHTDALRELLAQKPRAIIYVTDIKKLAGTETEKREFAKLASSFPQFYQSSTELERKGDESSQLKMPSPFENIKIVSTPKTSDGKIFAKDSVTRRMFVSYQDQLTFHPIFAAQFNPEVADEKNIRGTFDVYDSKQIYIDFAKPSAYPRVSFDDVMRHVPPENTFKDKVVLIGDDLGLTHDDYVYTPYLRTNNSTTLTELHANMFETLIRNSAPIPAPAWLDYLFTGIISILTVYVVLSVKPLRGIAILAGATAFFALIAFLAYWPFGIWVNASHPFLAVFLCYYFFIPYRLIIENRRSWEYYQKHKLLSEVEILKTNFIGMMSHDLKTPLARIQGMTEIISSEQAPLSTKQREALDTIRHSSEDLLKFISTILNYAKIESQGVQLHFESRDVNELFGDVVKKNEFLAKLKHIQLIMELEPLFSIKVDPELLKQVFSNLIENAVKYSPENSKVLITSEEIDGKVIVQVSDQGAGIPVDELPNIFTKFFRSKDAKASPIKGSGLGLYLAKYFVELHKGTISCESTVGQGSTFTVELPVSP